MFIGKFRHSNCPHGISCFSCDIFLAQLRPLLVFDRTLGDMACYGVADNIGCVLYLSWNADRLIKHWRAHRFKNMEMCLKPFFFLKKKDSHFVFHRLP